MLIEVQTIDRTTNLLVLQYALSTISEWNHCHALATNGHTSSQIVHLGIADLRCDITMSPSIQNTSTINTKQHSQTSLVCCMIHMCKSIYTALWIVVHITKYTINHTRCTCSCSNLTRIQHIQRERIVWLVTTSIGDRSTSFQTHLSSSFSTYYALLCKGWNDISNQRMIESIVIHQEVSHLIILEIPEHTL